MKWKFDDIDKAPELSHDLEWMVQSGQVSRQLLLETLANTYYKPIYRLAISLLGDRSAADAVVKEIFAYLVLNLHHYRSQMGIEIWIYQIAYRKCRRALRRERFWKTMDWWASSPGQFTDPLSSEPLTDFDKTLWKQIDSLDETHRIPLVLRYGNGWEIPLISKVVGYDEDHVGQLLLAGVMHLVGQIQAAWENPEVALQASLTVRWANIQPSSVQTFLEHMNIRTSRQATLRGGAATLKELMLVGLAVIFVLLVLWGGNRYFLGEEQLPSEDTGAGSGSFITPIPSSGAANVTPSPVSEGVGTQNDINGPSPTPTPTGVFYYVKQAESLTSIAGTLGVSEELLKSFNRLEDDDTLAPGQALVIPGSIPTARALRATPVTPVVRSRVPPAPESSDDVFNLLNPDEFSFQTLWFSAEVSTHIKSNLMPPSKITQMQVWISPRQFLLLGGRQGEEPQEVGIGMRRRLYLSNPGSNQPWFQRWNSRFSDPFNDSSLLYGLNLLFGDIGDLAVSEFVVLGESRIAGRDTWMVSQLNNQDERLGMLWLDKETGFIMRYRRMTDPEFNPETGQYFPDMIDVKSVAFDVDFPQELFDISLPWRGGYAADYTGKPGIPEIGGNDRIGYLEDLDRRIPELPEGYDLSQSRLRFRFPIGSERVISMARTDIIADGYYLGRINMGNPWNVSCQRSADGDSIVYRTFSSNKDDIISLSNGPYYLSLRKPLEIRRIVPSANRAGSDYAISPDSRYVTLWACERNGDPCGVYLHDIESHSWRRLIDVQDEMGAFVWSPEGDQLAMISENDAILIVGIQDGEVSYSSEGDEIPIPGSPLEDWGVEFPPVYGGLEFCINPPGR